jgi:prephenate dehydrogenase
VFSVQFSVFSFVTEHRKLNTEHSLRFYNLPMLFDTLTVVGVGLIGGSIGQAALKRGAVRRVIGVDRNAQSLATAQKIGALDEFTVDLADGVRGAALVIFCTPVDEIARQARQAALSCRKGTLLTDAGSTKANIVRDLEGQLPEGIQFVGSHPLAGSEKRGPEYASADLFEDKITIVTRTAHTDASAVERISEFWKALGSEVRYLDPEMHDCALATTSHLPHLAAAALAGLLPPAWQPFAASGFRDTTRIAAGDPALWAAICRENALAISETLLRYSNRLNEFRDAILNDDKESLIQLLSQAKWVRDALGS